LCARKLRLDDGTADGTEVLQVRLSGAQVTLGYERLDNEILAGFRLDRLARRTDTACYPPHVSRLHGYDADSTEPFALLLPYCGEPVGTLERRLLPREQLRFQVGLLKGLRWIAAAGIAHRGISPSTVRWDAGSQQVQICDFSLATAVGAPRTVVGTPPWAALEQQRSRQCRGQVTERDDVWAAGRLIYYVRTGEVPTGPGQLAAFPDLEELLDGVFGPPDKRPTALDLLNAMHAEDPLPRGIETDPLKGGRARFYEARAAKHAGIAAGDLAEPGPISRSAVAAGPGEAGATGRRSAGRVALAIGGLVIFLSLIGLVMGLVR